MKYYDVTIKVVINEYICTTNTSKLTVLRGVFHFHDFKILKMSFVN